MDYVLPLHPAASGLILGVPKIPLMQLRFIDGTAKNSGQRLDNVYQSHLVLASGKLVRQKKILFKIKKKIFVTFL